MSKTRRWKILLMIGAVLISISFLVFTNYLVQELSAKEQLEVKKIAKAFEDLNGPVLQDYGEILKTIQQTAIPIIVVNENGKIDHAKNLDSTRIKDTVGYLMKQVSTMRFYNNPIPIKVSKSKYHYIYYKEQQAITLLRYFPYFQLLLISLFLVISYIAFNTSRMNDQNKVWVGMAKETAHQIGTPLSSLIAWVEYLKTTTEPPGEEVIEDMEKDIERLEVITERFSKIGSTPELKPYPIYELIDESITYLRKRITNKVNIYITEDSDKGMDALINKNLFSWVIENLVKNAVDAMAGRGEISFYIKDARDFIIIDVKDTGKGIPRSNFKQVFKPGYTTKKRGWGLGLSLAKRIIDNYHKGEIIIKDSEIGKGTTFRIKLKRYAPNFQE